MNPILPFLFARPPMNRRGLLKRTQLPEGLPQTAPTQFVEMEQNQTQTTNQPQVEPQPTPTPFPGMEPSSSIAPSPSITSSPTLPKPLSPQLPTPTIKTPPSEKAQTVFEQPLSKEIQQYFSSPMIVTFDNKKFDLSQLKEDITTKLIFQSEYNPDPKRQTPDGMYRLPKSDGGGSVEYAGINERYHPEMVKLLRKLPEEARQIAAQRYYIAYTKPVEKYAENKAELYLFRDIGFNRGLGGLSAIVAYAAGKELKSSRKIESMQDSVSILRKLSPEERIHKIVEARKAYETKIVGVRPDLNKGLQKRFNDSLTNALTLLKQP